MGFLDCPHGASMPIHCSKCCGPQENNRVPRLRAKVVAIDFDGVIHRNIAPWTRSEEINDDPVAGAFEFIEKALKEFDVIIFSARANNRDARVEMCIWLKRRWLESGRDWTSRMARIDIVSTKPNAFIYIDDCGWHFEGVFPTMEELRAFESWTKKTENRLLCSRQAVNGQMNMARITGRTIEVPNDTEEKARLFADTVQHALAHDVTGMWTED